jgi:hypothetical protein
MTPPLIEPAGARPKPWFATSRNNQCQPEGREFDPRLSLEFNWRDWRSQMRRRLFLITAAMGLLGIGFFSFFRRLFFTENGMPQSPVILNQFNTPVAAYKGRFKKLTVLLFEFSNNV